MGNDLPRKKIMTPENFELCEDSDYESLEGKVVTEDIDFYSLKSSSWSTTGRFGFGLGYVFGS